jgi:hypothetical protein
VAGLFALAAAIGLVGAITIGLAVRDDRVASPAATLPDTT